MNESTQANKHVWHGFLLSRAAPRPKHKDRSLAEEKGKGRMKTLLGAHATFRTGVLDAQAHITLTIQSQVSATFPVPQMRALILRRVRNL